MVQSMNSLVWCLGGGGGGGDGDQGAGDKFELNDTVVLQIYQILQFHPVYIRQH